MKCNNSGFSMIEVLVASTIMIMIVMMLGMIFQQTSQAWRTGKQRADTYQQVRALFGSIQRDASAAIDQNSLPKHLLENAPFSGKNQSFAGQLAFYTLTGTGFDNDSDPSSGQPARRSITFVTYSGANRTVETYVPQSGGGYVLGSSQGSGAIVSPNLNGAQVQINTFQAYDENGGSVGGSRFPAYVTVSAGVNVQGVRSFDVGAASGGPDRTLGTGPNDIRGRDDIKTWAD
jgi:type II secretory pathway component PulJ